MLLHPPSLACEFSASYGEMSRRSGEAAKADNHSDISPFRISPLQTSETEETANCVRPPHVTGSLTAISVWPPSRLDEMDEARAGLFGVSTPAGVVALDIVEESDWPPVGEKRCWVRLSQSCPTSRFADSLGHGRVAGSTLRDFQGSDQSSPDGATERG